MQFAFDLISDLHVETWDSFDWTGQATSPYCVVAGDVARDRQRLLDTPCGTATEVIAYRALLLELIERYFSAPPTSHPLTSDEPWANSSRWPQVVIEQSEKQSTVLPPVGRWKALSEIDRHALFVLGRSKHAHEEFIAAMTLFFKDA